jgi:hypothetical protein
MSSPPLLSSSEISSRKNSRRSQSSPRSWPYRRPIVQALAQRDQDHLCFAQGRRYPRFGEHGTLSHRTINPLPGCQACRLSGRRSLVAPDALAYISFPFLSCPRERDRAGDKLLDVVFIIRSQVDFIREAKAANMRQRLADEKLRRGAGGTGGGSALSLGTL